MPNTKTKKKYSCTRKKLYYKYNTCLIHDFTCVWISIVVQNSCLIPNTSKNSCYLIDMIFTYHVAASTHCQRSATRLPSRSKRWQWRYGFPLLVTFWERQNMKIDLQRILLKSRAFWASRWGRSMKTRKGQEKSKKRVSSTLTLELDLALCHPSQDQR